MTAAPQYLSVDYVKTIARLTNRKVYGNQGETFISAKLLENQPLGGAPIPSTSSEFYCPVAVANAGQWTTATPSGQATGIGN